MSAAAARGELAAIGQALMAGDGAPGERRSRALAAPDAAAENAAFDDLMQAPAWLRQTPEERCRLARRVALTAMAPALAGSIDGAWLGHVAELCGEAEIDRAIDRAAARDTVEGGATLPACPADAIDARGFALLRESLPERLRRFITPGPPSGLPETRASQLVSRALEADR